MSRYQKGKTSLDFTAARDSEWHWHQLGDMQVCTSLQTDNHASTQPLSFFTVRMPFLPPNQQRQSTEGTLNVVRKCVGIFQCNFSTGNTRSYDKNACVYSTTLATNCLHDNGLFQPSATKATVVSALCYRHLYTIKTFYGDLLS